MNTDEYPIRYRLNLLITGVLIVLMLLVLTATSLVGTWWGILLLATAYAILMNSGYAMMHEAEHNLYHPSPIINHLGGVLLGLFFPAPYHLLRQGHIGHHIRNRSDDEAFDLYFTDDSAAWKHIQYYGILTGLFWIVIVAGSLIALVWPRFFSHPSGAIHPSFDRPTEALMETLNPKYVRYIQLEAAAILCLHGGIMASLGVPWYRYALVLFGFGYTWSALQYLHHFDTVRDVRMGARNVRTFRWLDRVLLNHNWHLVHHMYPTVPWNYLPQLGGASKHSLPGMIRTYLRMWKGPRLTDERLENRYVGQVIR